MHVILFTWDAFGEQKYDILANIEDIHVKWKLTLYGLTCFIYNFS